MGLGGAVYVILRIWRARVWLQESSVACLRSLQQALFHLSFVVVGPVIWELARLCPQQVPQVIYIVVATLWPLFATARGLVRHHREKEEKAQMEEEEAQKSRKWWSFRLYLPSLKEGFRMSAELEEEFCFWLSYWSCWPLMMLLRWSLVSLDTSGSGSAGLLIAVSLWLQYWKAGLLLAWASTSTIFYSQWCLTVLDPIDWGIWYPIGAYSC